VEVHDSARKHGVAEDDVIHTVDHALVRAKFRRLLES
jgi:hypothetical protein